MFIIIIGQSGAGKTTFVKEHFIKEPLTLKKDVIDYTECGNGIIALGKYGIEKRTQGTDTLSYSAKDKIKKQLKIFSEQKKTVVLEGDRITCKEILEYIKILGERAKIYLVVCSIKHSIERLRRAGSGISVSFVKMTKTKSKRMFLEYSRFFDGEIVYNDIERGDKE